MEVGFRCSNAFNFVFLLEFSMGYEDHDSNPSNEMSE
jgi:hypothetical protein